MSSGKLVRPDFAAAPHQECERIIGSAVCRDALVVVAEDLFVDRFGIRSIFVSAFSDPSTRARANVANPIAWLAKPVADRKLVTTVSAALRDIPDGSDGA